jgi:hypothetical protein
MTIPGFTAEAAVGSALGFYRDGQAIPASGVAIAPARYFQEVEESACGRTKECCGAGCANGKCDIACAPGTCFAGCDILGNAVCRCQST